MSVDEFKARIVARIKEERAAKRSTRGLERLLRELVNENLAAEKAERERQKAEDFVPA